MGVTRPANMRVVTRNAARVVTATDLLGTFVFALEGGLAGVAGHLDPVGVLVLAFATALGGGMMRDVLLGAVPPAAVRDWRYSIIVLAAAALAWALPPGLLAMADSAPAPARLLVLLDAIGLSLFAVAGTEKALDREVHPLPAIFLGALGGVGGGTIRDVLLMRVPHVLDSDIYATAAMLGAAVVVVARRCRLPSAPAALAGAAACLALRLLAVSQHWQLPRAG